MIKDTISITWLTGRRRSTLGHLVVIATLGFALNIQTAQATDCVVPSPGATSPVTLRGSPAASGAARGTLSPGQSLPLIASLPGWYETRLADGQAAFAAKHSTNAAPCLATTPAAPPAVPAAAAGTPFELHAIDVGTGLSVLVRGADFALLYDAGSNDDTARGAENRSLAYLATLQPALQSLDHVILSHPHRDHVELLPDVIAQFHPHDVWNSGAYNDICGYRGFLFAIKATPSIAYHTVTQDRGDEDVALTHMKCYGFDQPAQTLTLKHAARIGDQAITLGQNASMTFLYKDGSAHASFNENSLVMRLDLGTHRILFMGDAEAGGRKAPATLPSDTSIEGKLLACCLADLKADVLVVGHHGSMTSSRAKFLDAVGATLFIVSAGPTKYGTVVLPDSEIITELESRGTVFRTDVNDDSCVESKAKVGPDEDGKAGGCDNVLLAIPVNGPVAAAYRRVSD